VTWNETHKEKLVELITKTGAPGFLFYLEELKKPIAVILKNEKILDKADKYATAW